MAHLRTLAFGLVLSGIALGFLRPVTAQEQAPARSADDAALLDGILEKASVYARKLNDYAYYFVCREAVTEKLVGKTKFTYSRSSAIEGSAGGQTMSARDTSTTNTYLYEYQLVRKQGENEEKRSLIEKNGQRLIVPDAKLEAMRFHFENFAFGPIDIFGAVGRERHGYEIVGRDKVKGEKAIIIEARSTAETADYNPGGKVWVREGDNAILKIEWDQKTMAGFKDISAAADAVNAIPMFILVTEYGVEKNGIRFPSRVLMREAYLRTKTRKIQKVSEVTIDYKDYKFFQVEVETQ